MKSRISARAEFEDVIETGMGITESVHGRYSAGGKEVIALIEEINHLIESNKQQGVFIEYPYSILGGDLLDIFGISNKYPALSHEKSEI